jgi:hypothetical protein
MASGGKFGTNSWITKIETSLEKQEDVAKNNLTLNSLIKTLDNYDMLLHNDHETRKKAKQIILKASIRIIERNQSTYEKALAHKEGTRARLRGITSYANQLSILVEPVLLHIDEIDYARSVISDFMPKAEEAARFATRLDPVMAAQMLRVLTLAESLGLIFNQGLREVFEEIIQLHIAPKKLDASNLLLDLAQRRYEEGEYLTSYLLSREAARSILEDLTGAYPQDLGPAYKPSPDWIFEDYLGYLVEVGLVSVEQGEEFQEIFVGEAEHLNSRWRKRREAERALSGIRNYVDILDKDGSINDKWM